MRSIEPTGLAGIFIVVSFSLALAAATPAKSSDRAMPPPDRTTPATGTVAESGRFDCSLTADGHQGSVTVTDGTLNQGVVVKLGNWRSTFSEVRIHRSVLYPIFLKSASPVVRDSKAENSYLRFGGTKISAQDDAIIANFQNNAAALPEHQIPSSHRRTPTFSGYKAHLGRHIDNDSDGRAVEVDVYLRLIIDWRHQTRRQNALSLHRAALVLSQVPIGDGREKFYRFQPDQRPFRMLACVLQGAQVI